jgi:hypothetical protein
METPKQKEIGRIKVNNTAEYLNINRQKDIGAIA